MKKLQLLFVTPLLFLVSGVAFAQHSVVQHGKESVCPLPAVTQDKDAQPVLQDSVFDADVFIPNTICFDEPELFPRISPELVMTDFNMRLFDRWGNIIFASTDPSKRWNGHVQGQSGFLPEGTIICYLITFTDQAGVKRKYCGHAIMLGYCHCG